MVIRKKCSHGLATSIILPTIYTIHKVFLNVCDFWTDVTQLLTSITWQFYRICDGQICTVGVVFHVLKLLQANHYYVSAPDCITNSGVYYIGMTIWYLAKTLSPTVASHLIWHSSGLNSTEVQFFYPL
jgi:hypothetical protein